MRKARLGRATCIAVIAALVVVASAVFWTTRSLRAINRADLGGALSAVSGGGENFLVVGSDSRDGASETDADIGSMGTEEDVGGKRSDTIMLVRLEGGRATLLSLPRDLYVPISGASRTFRLNSAYSRGPDVLVRTVQDALGVPVHHYVEVDFRGFKKLVEAVGGVSVSPMPTPACSSLRRDVTGLTECRRWLMPGVDISRGSMPLEMTGGPTAPAISAGSPASRTSCGGPWGRRSSGPRATRFAWRPS
jgi:hypothetical protein